MAARGARDLDHGTELIADPADRTALRQQARAVHIQAAIRGSFLTVLAFAFRILAELSR